MEEIPILRKKISDIWWEIEKVKLRIDGMTLSADEDFGPRISALNTAVTKVENLIKIIEE